MAEHSIFDHWGGLLAAIGGAGVATRYLSAAARALPALIPMGSRFYQWFYAFVQNVLANPDLAQAEAVKTKRT